MKTVTGVSALVSVPSGRMENATIFSVEAGPGVSLWFSTKYSGEPYKVSLFVGGGEVSSTGIGEDSEISLLLPRNSSYAGKKVELVLMKGGRIVDRATIVYCGDGVCSKGERTTTCPSDCKLAGLAPQQDSKRVPYLAAGLLLIVLAGIVIYLVTTRQRQGP